MTSEESGERLMAIPLPPRWRARLQRWRRHLYRWWVRLLGPITPGGARAAVFLFVLALLLAALNLLWTSRQVDSLNAKTSALCRFDADLGSAPVTVRTGKPPLLGVSIVSDARVAWHQTGCTGRLNPPTPSFVHWAAYYHLPVN